MHVQYLQWTVLFLDWCASDATVCVNAGVSILEFILAVV